MSKVMMGTCMGDRPLKESIELLLRLSSHVSDAGSKAIGK
jgi:hypothetical protein